MTQDGMLRVLALVAHQSMGAPVTLAHVCAAAVAGVPVAGVGVTVRLGPSVSQTMYATDEVAALVEELQVTVGQGPCPDSVGQGGPILVGDLCAPEYLARWPAFAPAALDRGVRAVFALPLQLGVIRWGTMDLYRSTPGSLIPRELADGLAFAECVAMLLLDPAAGPALDLGVMAWHGGGSTAYQAEVHQATGILVIQLGVGADAAFARLRAYAFAHGRRLGDVARDIVGHRLRLDRDPLPDDRL